MGADRVVIAGNGILGRAIAFELLRREPQRELTLVGPIDREGCATMAAGAMLNSFAELEEGALDHEVDRLRFGLSVEATRRWDPWLAALNELSGVDPVAVDWGTFVVNNTATDRLDDRNFEAIVRALKEYGERYEHVSPGDIHGYSPSPRRRALRAVYLPGEGHLNPGPLLGAIDALLERLPNDRAVDAKVAKVVIERGVVRGVTCADGVTIHADRVVLATGATLTSLLQGTPIASGVPRVFYGVGCSLLLRTGALSPRKVVRTPNRGLACGVYQVPYGADHSCVGATNFISPEPEFHPRITSVEALLRAAMEQLNTGYYKSQLVKMNIGFRPTSADTYPIMGATSVPGLFIASGTKRDGFHMAPVWGPYLADLIDGRSTDERLLAFRPERPLISPLSPEAALNKAVDHPLYAAYQHDLEMPKSGWEESMEAFLRSRVEAVYEARGISSYGIAPELLDMYRYGHIASD